MALITDTITVNLTGTDGSRIQSSSTETGSTQTNLDIPIPAGVTNQLVAMSFIVANVQCLFLVSNQDVTLKTNSTTAPGNTLTLKAGIAYMWRKSATYNALLFTVDVTGWYFTTTASARVQAGVLVV
jgi:hypothetical protein